ncbi:MAG: hypothetical protein J6D29_02310 [Solobacterium sp.]|nr:hypothetical protein [Solobacterium sp.]
MAINKVTYGNQTLIDLTDSTLSSSNELVNGVTAYDRSGTLLTGTANYMDLVSNPTADDILVTDANGQAVDSGVDINDVAMLTDLPSQATDSTLGLVKINSAESVTLNSSGQLDVGGRLGQFSGTTGIFHSKDRAPRNVANYSLLITDALGIQMDANRSFAVVSGVGVTITGAHAAGVTEYRVTNSYSNRILCAGLKYMSLDEATSTVKQIVEVTSVTINGSTFTPDSSANDSTNPIVIKVAESLNPDSALASGTSIRGFSAMKGYASEFVGSCVGADAGGANLMLGQGVFSKTGNMNVVLGQYHYNQGNGNTLLGRWHVSKKNRWFMAGTGHDNSNGRSEAGAVVGQYSNITTNTLFAVGDGTSHTARSNAFEILADGRVKASGTPTENDDLTNKAYVDSAIGGGGLALTTYGNADFSYQQELDPDTQEVINECVAYSTVAGNVNEPKAVKYGRVVNMSGAFKNINVRPSNATFVMGKVPSGCEPLYNQYIMQQGSSQYKYLLQIQTDGTMSCQRYSASASAIAVTNNAWLNINATYISAS